MEFFWLGVVLLLSVIEMATADLITIWFIASGIVTLIISFFDISFVAQVGIFVVLGTVLLITTRKTLVEKMNKNKQKTNLDRVVGMEGVVTEKITKHNPGEVKVDGKKWTAISNDGKNISEGKNVKIIKIEGVKLIVEEE